MLRIILIAVAVLLLGLLAIGLWFTRGLNISQYEHLKDPAISTMADQKMLIVEAVGDPNVVGDEAVGLLYETYFRTEGTPKELLFPRARWPFDLATTPPSEWVGFFALPVPESVTKLPADLEVPEGLKVELTTWEYGEVAEILHYGSYEDETPTIERLMAFIAGQGYEVVGPHEEVYLQGPENQSRDPKDYITIIRYRVKKIGS